MARKGTRYSQQDPSPRKGVKKDCAECQKLYSRVKEDRYYRRAYWLKSALELAERAYYAGKEAGDTAALKAHVATHA